MQGYAQAYEMSLWGLQTVLRGGTQACPPTHENL